jgi:hypothetical protein
MQAAATTATDPAAREYAVVVVKGTFLIPDDSGPAELAPKSVQAPLVMADTFTGAPGLSAPVFESDFARRKPLCDVLVVGNAYAPEGRATSRCKVGIRLGQWQKLFDVVGDRTWRLRVATVGPSEPEPFVTMPVTYDRAFGGIDDSDPGAPDAYRHNPVGRGYGKRRSAARLVGRPLPNTEESDEPVVSAWGEYRPMSLGPVHRSWQPRLALAGTYDQKWLDDVFPFLPPDFDDRHYQAAPDDQQIQPPGGGEELVLVNLGVPGRLAFRLPANLEMPMAFFLRDGEPEFVRAMLDTVIVAPDDRRLYIVWRYARPLRRNIFELSAVQVGQMSHAWWRARRSGKTYYPGLGALVRQRRTEAASE